MRPVRLTMQAFGPYPTRETVDFREAVDAGLFGIYGQTGSGKSTIFSAMTFALFGEPAKSEQDAPSLRSDHADADVQTEVEFVFDIGERRFVVVRQPEQTRPRKRGEGAARSLHVAFLFDATGLMLDDIREGQRGRIIAERKVREVDDAIEKILGYGAAQFRQIVLLPQGRFETFLASKTPDRLSILRELFDVALYRELTVRLKAGAEAAEREVSQEREHCVRRLKGEGFESTEAMTIAIAEADGRREELIQLEEASRLAVAVAQTEVQEARKIEERFIADEHARKQLAVLQAGKSEMDALAERVVRAERARFLLDPEAGVVTTAGDVGAAEARLLEARNAASQAEARDRALASALKVEADRAGEIDMLTRQVAEFERHQKTLEQATHMVRAVEAAQMAERAANDDLNAAAAKLQTLQSEGRVRADTLRQARIAGELRHSFQVQLAALRSSFDAATTFESAQAAVDEAARAVEQTTVEHERARQVAEAARKNCEDAERSLSEAQALHLASKLAPGESCPVCGATEHPAPATGSIVHSGRDLAFREANDKRAKADAASRAAENKLTGARSILAERQTRLASVEAQGQPASTIQSNVAATEKTLNELGPPVDLAKAETELDSLKGEIDACITLRDAFREALADKRNVAASTKARLDQALSSIPEPQREPPALATALGKSQQALTDRRNAVARAQQAATAAREASLSAAKDRQAAEAALEDCRERHRGALELFGSRLAQASLSRDEFQGLKPAIVTLDEDRTRIESYRRGIERAEEAASMAASAIHDQIRPDLLNIGAMQVEAEKKLTEATEQRVRTVQRLEYLSKLRDDLAETSRRLDEAEAASGPLRKLAALANGVNPQNLDLETFAIGAMFDQVLEAANRQLGPMTSSRYRLERDLEGAGRGRRGLGIQVFDSHTGKARSTETLSGGETFIAALALALGLADVVESANGKVRLDTIFIDEGFGSLDTENGAGTLDQVLQALSALVSQSRAVGVISHVPLVQEAIPNGFYVRKNLTGSSVEARGVV